MHALFAAVRFVANVILAFVVFALALLLLFAGYTAFYLPMFETVGLDDGAQEGTWVWIADRPVYHRTWGDATAPAVVLVHGDMVEGSLVWEGIAPDLAERGLHVIAVDLPGYGHSERGIEPVYSLHAQAGVLAQVLNNLGLQQATLVGHGEGAGVVLQLAAEQPQFVGNMVLVSPQLDARDTLLWRTLLRQPHIGRALVWAFESGGPFFGWQRSRMVADPSRYPEGYLEDAKRRAHIIGTADTLRMVALTDPEDNLPEAIEGLQMSTLILRGEQDRTLTESQAADLVGLFPDAALVNIPRAGHLSQIDQPGLVSDQIALVAGVAPATAP